MKWLLITAWLLAAPVFAQEPSTNIASPAAVAQRAYDLGMGYLRESNFATAVELFEYATQMQPGFAEAHWQWGVALLQLGRLSGTPQTQAQRYQEAAAKFSRAAELKPGDYTTWLLWSEVLVLIGDLPVEREVRLSCYQGAVEKCQKAVELSPEGWEAYSRWGTILTAKLAEFAVNERARIQFHKEAGEKFSKAVEYSRYSGDLGSSLANWGASLVRGARASTARDEKEAMLRQAIEKFERAARAVPNAASTYTMWGSALVQLGKLTRLRTDFRDAVNQFNISISLKPDDSATLYASACAHSLMGNPMMTVEMLKKCFAADATGAYRKLALQDPDLAALQSELSFQELFTAPSKKSGVPGYNPPLHNTPR